ncbi:sugar phosphate isomerase/epimerase family protein [Rugamonas sp. CCM 8940]|uniref:sugar phosphate isomerase/epimerase family protein n=1 Tax=Rugamonas sp. CCM 8940 TaxID=2765359 RepID=UPI0018F3CCF0|nr:TIM barrel protein [Rugamonas sp. CCM 8940]MBJ7311270.1 sugar phosphate isomerase/epimerase [Rugamonas sp. CCM 8940]
MSAGAFLTGIADEAAAGLAEQIACHRALGWRHLELRSVDGVAVARLSPAQRDSVCLQLAEAGFSVPVIDSQIGNWSSTIAAPFAHDLAELDTLLALAARTGTRMIRVMSYPNVAGAPWSESDWSAEVVLRLRALARLAGEQGVTLLHENCAGWGGSSIVNALHLARAVDDPHFRLLFDIGNGLSYGYTALDYLEQLLPWIAHVHLKDGQLVDGEVVYTMPGEGGAGVRDCLRYLAERQYAGGYAIEPHLHLIPHLRAGGGDGALMLSSYQAYARRTAALIEQAGGAAAGVLHAA